MVIGGSETRFDLNRDGRVSADEVVAVAYAEQGLSKEEMVDIVKEADLNKDGYLDKSNELPEAEAALQKSANEKAQEWLQVFTIFHSQNTNLGLL